MVLLSVLFVGRSFFHNNNNNNSIHYTRRQAKIINEESIGYKKKPKEIFFEKIVTLIGSDI